MGICDFRGAGNGDKNQVIFETPVAAKNKQELTFKDQNNENNLQEEVNEVVENKSLENFQDNHITFNNSEPLLIEEENNNRSHEVNNHVVEENEEKNIHKIENISNIQIDFVDNANDSLDQIESTVQPVIVNKQKWENCKIEHPLKKELVGGFKNLLKTQINVS